MNDDTNEHNTPAKRDNKECEACLCRYKAKERPETEIRQLQNRLNRIIGQLGGIKKMLDDNRYCGDILTQIAAAESALQALGYLILQDHLNTCVTAEVLSGSDTIMAETVELIKKLK